MKFLHLADLHLGKRVNGFDMLEDQRFILEQILTLCEKHGVEAVVIAGDIYDTPVPPAAACTLLDWFLTQLAAVGLGKLHTIGTDACHIAGAVGDPAELFKVIKDPLGGALG